LPARPGAPAGRVRRACGVALALLILLVLAGRVGLLGPASVGLPVALLAVFAGCAVALTHVRTAALRLLAAAGALLASSAFGISLVNHYYDYYQSWSALGSDLAADNGASTRVALIPVLHPQVDAPRGAPRAAPGGPGRLVTIPIPGTASGIVGRTALVWLPAQYDDPRYAAVHFPVLELLHGDPGGPRSWLTLDLTAVLDQQAAHATTDPTVIVMPYVNGGFRNQQCLNAPGAPQLDTYLARDIPAGLAAGLRIDPPGPHWAVGGLSSGGYCAARLALHYPHQFGAAAIMDGYFHPDLARSLRQRLYGKGPVPASDDPTRLLASFPPGEPLPAFWIMAGTANAADYHDASSFATALGRKEDLRFLTVIGGRHTPPAWRAALPDLLRWAAATVHGETLYGQAAIPL